MHIINGLWVRTGKDIFASENQTSGKVDDKTIKNNICLRRRELRITQEDMADRLSMKRNTYRNIEKGGTAILNPHMEEIAAILQTSTLGLILGDFDIGEEYGNTLSDVETRYESRYGDKISCLEAKIEKLEEENRSNLERIRELEDRVSDKEQIISFLKSQSKRRENTD